MLFLNIIVIVIVIVVVIVINIVIVIVIEHRWREQFERLSSSSLSWEWPTSSSSSTPRPSTSLSTSNFSWKHCGGLWYNNKNMIMSSWYEWCDNGAPQILEDNTNGWIQVRLHGGQFCPEVFTGALKFTKFVKMHKL